MNIIVATDNNNSRYYFDLYGRPIRDVFYQVMHNEKYDFIGYLFNDRLIDRNGQFIYVSINKDSFKIEPYGGCPAQDFSWPLQCRIISV